MGINMDDDLIEAEKIAIAATSTALNPFIVNLQLEDWVEAKTKFYNLRDGEYHWSEGTKIVNLLGNSLTTLFGMNNSSQGNMPALLSFVKSNFYCKKWNLKSENPELYQRFIELDDLHKDITKHMGQNKVEKAKKLLAGKDQLARQMETTRQIWIWFLQKRAGNKQIPPDQKTEFCDKFE